MRGLLVFSALFLFACGDDPEPTSIDEQFVEGESPQIGPADAPSITFQEFEGFVPSADRAMTPQRRLISSDASFKSVFGVDPPGWADFSENWMVFYSAGVPDAVGVYADIESLRLSSTGKSLQVVTREVLPDNCAVGVPSAPAWTLVQFQKPNLRPQSVRYYGSTDHLTCQTSCDGLVTEFENVSRGLWYTRESDYPYDSIFHAGAADSISDDAVLAQTLGATGPIESVDFDEWFDRRTTVEPDEDPYYVEQAAQLKLIRASMEANLTDLRVVRIGEIQVHIFIVGRTSCGDLAGLHTISIET